ncbi:TIGR04141 family sporadically distributed protein [Sphaerisporangium sp. NPDC051017]|uniref:TIGR04141 family sporadically distributed protein n=1 Tax=Sphaerisporangium sp. NPDC051017 TaxID=3154636 RepID=UPI00341C687F
MLGSSADGNVLAVVPTDCLDGYAQARRFTIKVGSACVKVDSLHAEHFLQRARLQRPGKRVEALRTGKVHMFRDEECTDATGGAAAIKWLEAVVAIDDRRYFLLDGEWYEIDVAYLESKLDEIRRLFVDRPSVDLPAWRPGDHERTYNRSVQDLDPGYLCMDREMVRTVFFNRGGFEVCDLLGPQDVLIHVKFAQGADSLSHLFTQGGVSAQTLLRSDEALGRFAELVARVSKGSLAIAVGFRPRKVVFAILLKKGVLLTPESLFPLARVALANAARLLNSHGIEVEVVGISAATNALAA